MSKQVVLITSATGRIGRELIARLSANSQITVRAMNKEITYKAQSMTDFETDFGKAIFGKKTKVR